VTYFDIDKERDLIRTCLRLSTAVDDAPDERRLRQVLRTVNLVRFVAHERGDYRALGLAGLLRNNIVLDILPFRQQ
jgi:hypothetical protein